MSFRALYFCEFCATVFESLYHEFRDTKLIQTFYSVVLGLRYPGYTEKVLTQFFLNYKTTEF